MRVGAHQSIVGLIFHSVWAENVPYRYPVLLIVVDLILSDQHCRIAYRTELDCENTSLPCKFVGSTPVIGNPIGYNASVDLVTWIRPSSPPTNSRLRARSDSRNLGLCCTTLLVS